MDQVMKPAKLQLDASPNNTNSEQDENFEIDKPKKKMLSINPPTPSSNPRQPRKRKLRNKEDKIQTPKINTFFKQG